MRQYKNVFEKIICNMERHELIKLRDFCSRKQVINAPSISAVNRELEKRKYEKNYPTN